jgi:hypothetical protein
MVETWKTIGPGVGLIIAPLVALTIKANASPATKRTMSIIITLVVAGVSLLGEDWETINPGVILNRVVLLFGEGQLVYLAASEAVERWTSASSPNELKVFAPDKGIG